MEHVNMFKNTKIVCTIGPASEDMKTLKKLIENGMNVLRMNFSHGDYDEQLKKLERCRLLEEEGIYIPAMLDTKGPEIRTNDMENGKISIKKGQITRISMKKVLGTPEKISVTFDKLFDDVSIGNHIKIDDGKLNYLVIGKDEAKREIICEAQNDHDISSKKGVNCSGAKLNSLDFISEKDLSDLIWGCENGVDFISASFVRCARDVQDIRNVLITHGHPEIKIIAKIENYEAIGRLEEIVDASDAIMVARGDLGLEIPEEEVPIIQKKLIDMCRAKGKPVITATQMLDSMVYSPIPTRAEVSDVATAITESTDCVMLSGESASGKYPVEAVQMQAKIAHTMEKTLDYETLAKEAYDTSNKDNNDALANAIANTAKLIGAKLIVSFTSSGRSSRRISKARPCCPILSISNELTTVRQNAIYWGVYSVLLKSKKMPQFIEDMEVVAIAHAKRFGLQAGDTIIISGGTPTGSGRTNFMRIVTIPKDRDLL
ncbi:MAG: pyruvate kinase [bacterium]|nr:pyruvate kinase [bacterium]